MRHKYTELPELAFQEWVHDNRECTWLNCTFGAPGQRLVATSRAMTALNWTIDDLQRVFNKKKTLKFVPYIGGEPSVGIAAHVHALLELPHGQTFDRIKERIANRWPYFLEKQFGRPINGTAWLRPYEHNQCEEQRYFMRNEGSTFSMGLEKVLFEHVRL